MFMDDPIRRDAFFRLFFSCIFIVYLVYLYFLLFIFLFFVVTEKKLKMACMLEL